MEFPALNRRALLPQRTAEFKHQLPLHPNRGKNRAHQVQQNNTTRHGSSMLSHCGILCIEATHRRIPNQHQHPLPQTGGIKPGPNGRLQQISIHASTLCLFKMQWPIQLQTVSNNTTFSLRYAKAVYKILHLTKRRDKHFQFSPKPSGLGENLPKNRARFHSLYMYSYSGKMGRKAPNCQAKLRQQIMSEDHTLINRLYLLACTYFLGIFSIL